MAKKIAVITALLFTFLTSSSTNAQIDNTSKLLEFNPFCWHRSDCQKIRKQFGGTGTGDEGFITGKSVAPCVGGIGDDQWGRCLPAGTSKTEISFGGKSEFSNVGEFIVLMYKYLLTIASIVAVVMIIIAGAQWITSGGNSEAIGSAKKRIGGAIIGLFIAYMSYFVLNTINPALVNLRLPQVWLIKPQNLMPEFCEDIEGAKTGKIKFMLGSESRVLTGPITPETADGKQYGFGFKMTKDEKRFYCGTRWFAESGGNTPCRGKVCDDEDSNKLTCLNKLGDRQSYECTNAKVYGRISYADSGASLLLGCSAAAWASKLPGTTDRWKCPPVGEVKLLAVCDVAHGRPVGEFTIPDNLGDGNYQLIDEKLRFGDGHIKDNGTFWVEYPSKDISSPSGVFGWCSKYFEADLKGFVIKFRMVKVGTNRDHYIGKKGVDLGSFDQGMINKLYRVKDEHLFQLADILNSIRVDVDAADIEDNEDISDKNKSYWEEQYKGVND